MAPPARAEAIPPAIAPNIITSLKWLETNNLFNNLIQRNQSAALDRKSGSAGMPRPISYAVFCLKKKKQQPLRKIPDNISIRHAEAAVVTPKGDANDNREPDATT